jgi:hypothetical protein
MNVQATSGAAPPVAGAPAIAGVAPEDVPHIRRVLDDLAAMSADRARVVHARVQELGAAAAPGADRVDLLVRLAFDFDRIAFALRRAIVLSCKLAEAPAYPARGHAARPHRVVRKRILREVEDAIRRNADARRAGTLAEEAPDALDEDDPDEGIGDRPAVDIIAEICRDLGRTALPDTAPWKSGTPADIAALCALAARPAWPCAVPPPVPEAGATAGTTPLRRR